jgi:hypothetical protein
LKGRERESIRVGEFLSAYLPKRFGFANGEIVSVNDEVSSECDVIIYDEMTCPILKKGTSSIVPIEAANAVVEVKSHLDTGELLKSAENIAAIKRMPKSAFYRQDSVIKYTFSMYGKKWEHYPTLGFVFAYTSIGLDTLAANLDQFYQSVLPEHRIDYVCILDSGGLIHTLGLSGGMQLFAQSQTRIGYLTSENPLMPFLVILQNLLLQNWPTFPVRLGDYFGEANLGRAHATVGGQPDQDRSK